MCTTVLLRDNVTNTRNLFRVTSSFVLIESASGMHFSLDYQPIEVNRRRYRKLRHRMQLRTRTKLHKYRILSQAKHRFTHSYKI